jgi:hypothetical protein
MKKKPGQKPLGKGETQRISLRLTRPQLTSLDRHARRAKLSRSAFIRRWIDGLKRIRRKTEGGAGD